MDVSPDALDVAQRNAGRHHAGDRITFRQGDLFAAAPAGSTFDLIASNPPYVTPAELSALSPDVRDHEPRLALDGGPDGLSVYQRIVAQAGDFLNPDGHLILEIGATQEAAVRGLIEQACGFALAKTVPDGAKLPRVVVAKRN